MTRKAEPEFFRLLNLGKFSIDDEGRIWRYPNCGPVLVPPKRAESKPHGNNKHLLVRLRRGVQVSAHRVVWIYFNGPIQDGLEPNHINGDKTDNSSKNLELITHQENSIHSIRILQRRIARGEVIRSSKLMEYQIRNIRQLGETNISHKDISKRFGVSQAQISNIIARRCWKHIK